MEDSIIDHLSVLSQWVTLTFDLGFHWAKP